MKHYEVIEVPAHKSSRLAKRTCDMCQCEIPAPARFRRDESVTIEQEKGDALPEGGRGETISLDICGACFEVTVLPMLHALGATHTRTEWDY